MHRRLPTSLPRWPASRVGGLVLSALAYTLLTLALAPFFDDEETLNVSLIYLLLTLMVSAAWGYTAGIAGALAADLLVNFFFVTPLYTFTVQEPSNVLGLFIFLAVALIGASMLSLLRRQVNIAEARRAETAAVLSLSQEIAHAATPREALDRLCIAVVRTLHARGCAVARMGERWEVLGSSGGLAAMPREEQSLAAEAVRTGEVIRYGSGARLRAPGLPRGAVHAPVMFVPFGPRAPERGVLHITGEISAPRLADGDRLLRAFADEASLAVHRSRLAEEAGRVAVLQKADEFKSAILSSVSHDLRSPLTAIKAAVESLRDDEIEWSDDDRASFLETIESQTDRLTVTVTNLLEMSRLEGGAVRPKIEPIEVAALLDEVRAATAEVTAGRDVCVAGADELWLSADYVLITQSLGNLIENAAKYSLPGRDIRLAAARDGEHIVLTIADRGPGIPAGDVPHIFEKFYRGAQDGKTKGTGLGLSIVKAMIELCGGDIRVSSSPAGAVFIIELPRAGSPRR